jgi:ABC-type transport system substrate-binding protein
MHALDRQQLADSLMSGMSAVAHNYLNPHEPDNEETAQFVTRYEYDPRRAVSLIEELGYTRGTDGAFRDRAGDPLSVNIQTTAQLDIHSKTMYPVVDYWQRIGVTADTTLTPAALVRDRDPGPQRPRVGAEVGDRRLSSCTTRAAWTLNRVHARTDHDAEWAHHSEGGESHGRRNATLRRH